MMPLAKKVLGRLAARWKRRKIISNAKNTAKKVCAPHEWPLMEGL